MSVEIKLVVQCHDSKSGELLEEEVILNDELNKAIGSQIKILASGPC